VSLTFSEEANMVTGNNGGSVMGALANTPASSPTFMTWLNLAGTIFGALEASGVTNMLGAKGGWIAIVATGLNAIAHSISAPTAGPLNNS
jgi:hypothetical protein